MEIREEFFLPYSRVLLLSGRIMNGKCTRVLSALTLGTVFICGASIGRAQVEGEYQVQPIFTRYAETVKTFSFNATARVFNDVQLQEADRYDGWGVDADLTVRIPYTKHFQVRVMWPFYTEGDARLIDPGHKDTGRRINVRGYGGTFDYASVELAYQLLDESKHYFNASVYGGAGERQRILWTDSVDHDIYNHQGDYALFGVRADWHYGNDWRFVLNLGARDYFKSDDLNPEGTGSNDEFYLSDFSVAAIYHPWKCPVFPVAELVYQTTFSDYNSVLFVPEVIVGVCKNFEIKAGATVGLTGDGESYGGRFQATTHF
jgi:hypothetical protein